MIKVRHQRMYLQQESEILLITFFLILNSYIYIYAWMRIGNLNFDCVKIYDESTLSPLIYRQTTYQI